MHPKQVVKKLIPKQVFKAIEPYGHLAEAAVLNTVHGFPAEGLKVIGVTGTNGKTTTAYLIHRMLHEAGYKVALNTTVGWGVGDKIIPQKHHMTNVAVPELMQRLKYFQSQKVEWLVLETTSHALAQYRTWGVRYSMAVLTNLTHEHLAYHGTFERYRDAKRRLFTLTNANKQGMQLGIINADDPNANYFIKDIRRPVTYGVEGGDAQARDIKLSANGSTYSTTINDMELRIACQLPGTVNVYNSLAAACVGQAIGLSKQQIEKGIAALPSVAGRMTVIDQGQPFTAIVDYAHSPDSFEKLFTDIKPTTKGRLIVVFGSLGGGDTAKRPLQGELAGRFADFVIVTEEDNRNENPDAIVQDIMTGVTKAGKVVGKNALHVPNREQAIAHAVSEAKKGDVVLFLGKGHEKTIERADGEHDWDEVAQVRGALTKAGYKASATKRPVTRRKTASKQTQK